jgi:hypothetical protein
VTGGSTLTRFINDTNTSRQFVVFSDKPGDVKLQVTNQYTYTPDKTYWMLPSEELTVTFADASYTTLGTDVSELSLEQGGNGAFTITGGDSTKYSVTASSNLTATLSGSTVTVTASSTYPTSVAGVVTISDGISSTSVEITVTAAASSSSSSDSSDSSSSDSSSSDATEVSGDLSLNSGWTMVTWPANMTANTQALLDVASDSSSGSGKKVVWIFDGSSNGYADMGAAMDVTAGTGMWVKSTTAQTVTVTGTESASAFDVSAAYDAVPAYSGWKLIGVSADTTVADITAAGISGLRYDAGAWCRVGAPAGYDSVSACATTLSAGAAFWATK